MYLKIINANHGHIHQYENTKRNYTAVPLTFTSNIHV